MREAMGDLENYKGNFIRDAWATRSKMGWRFAISPPRKALSMLLL